MDLVFFSFFLSFLLKIYVLVFQVIDGLDAINTSIVQGYIWMMKWVCSSLSISWHWIKLKIGSPREAWSNMVLGHKIIPLVFFFFKVIDRILTWLLFKPTLMIQSKEPIPLICKTRPAPGFSPGRQPRHWLGPKPGTRWNYHPYKMWKFYSRQLASLSPYYKLIVSLL